MNTYCTLVFLLICVNSVLYVQTKKFALLLTTTKSWLHYGHQSTMLHVYQTLIANGVLRRDTITMFYDDIAHNLKNPEPGVIRNHPRGENVYRNVKKDYTGKKVTADNFLAVLTGNTSVAQGPVFRNTGPKDTLFIYMVGLATYQYLTFPTGPGISARKLSDTIQSLTAERKFDKIYVNADVSFAATLFEGLLSAQSKVFAVTATSFDEHPHAVYCFPEERLCYGSLYGVAWSQYVDRLRQLKSGATRTLYDQFNHVRAETPYTRVNMYGDLRIGKSLLRDFIAYKLERKANPNATNSHKDNSVNKLGLGILPSQARTFVSNQNQNIYNSANYNHDRQGETEENYIVPQDRSFIEETMKNIFDRLRSYGYTNLVDEDAKGNRHFLTEHVSNVYEEAINEFHNRCFNINENPFVLHELPKLAHLCENGVNLNDLSKAMAETCTAKHRLTLNVY